MSSRSIISREQFLKPLAVPREDVPVPEFGDGCVVPVWGMTARQRMEFDRSLQNRGGKVDPAKRNELRERLVVACCRDDEGQPLFEPQDVAAIGDQSAAVVNRLFDVAWKLCGFAMEDIGELAKNSEGTASD